MIRAVVCEDNLLVREGIVTLLAAEPDIAVVAQAGALDEALAAVAEHDPDVVLTDIRMPPTHTDEGVRVAAALRRSHPGLGVVVLSQYDDPDHALRVFDGVGGWHADVGEHDVGVVLGHRGQRLVEAARLRHHGDVRLGGEQRDDALAHQ